MIEGERHGEDTGAQWRKQNTSNANFGRNLHPSTRQRRPRHRSMRQKAKTRVPAQLQDSQTKEKSEEGCEGRGREVKSDCEDTENLLVGYAKMILRFNLLLSLCTSFHCSFGFQLNSNRSQSIPIPPPDSLSLSVSLICQSLGSIVPAAYCKSFVRFWSGI